MYQRYINGLVLVPNYSSSKQCCEFAAESFEPMQMVRTANRHHQWKQIDIVNESNEWHIRTIKAMNGKRALYSGECAEWRECKILVNLNDLSDISHIKPELPPWMCKETSKWISVMMLALQPSIYDIEERQSGLKLVYYWRRKGGALQQWTDFVFIIYIIYLSILLYYLKSKSNEHCKRTNSVFGYYLGNKNAAWNYHKGQDTFLYLFICLWWL